MFNIDLEVQVDRVDYHVHNGKQINLRGTAIMVGVEDTEEVAVRALRQAFARYCKAAHTISSDGP